MIEMKRGAERVWSHKSATPRSLAIFIKTLSAVSPIMSPALIHFVLSSSRRRTSTSIPPSTHLLTHVYFAPPIRPYHKVLTHPCLFVPPFRSSTKYLDLQPFLRWQRRQEVGKRFYLSIMQGGKDVHFLTKMYCTQYSSFFLLFRLS